MKLALRALNGMDSSCAPAELRSTDLRSSLESARNSGKDLLSGAEEVEELMFGSKEDGVSSSY